MTTRANLETMAEKFRTAACLTDIFGRLEGTPDEQRLGLKQAYRLLCKACHPDIAETQDKSFATTVFQQLESYRRLADQRLQQGDYTAPLPLQADSGSTYSYQVDGRTLTLGKPLGTGLFATVYAATLEGESDDLMVKIADHPSSNPFLKKEMEILERLRRPSSHPEREQFYKVQRMYLPRPIGTLTAQFPDFTEKCISVLGRTSGEAYLATDLLQRFGGQVDKVHAYWIYRRLLLTLLMTQMRGLAHTAITPDHILIYPEHGLVLLDWCGACRLDQEPVRQLDPTYKAFYPPEVFAKEPVNKTTDLYQAGKFLQYLLGGNPAGNQFPGLPRLVSEVLSPTIRQDKGERPSDLLAYYDRFQEAIEAAHGKRQFVPLVVPSNV